MDQQKITKVAAIVIGVVIAAVLVIFGFILIQSRFSRASGETANNVVVNGITTNSATVSFSTDDSVQCTVMYGTSAENFSFFAEDSTSTTSHAIELTLLSAETTYYFKINCGNTETTNNGAPFTFTTLSNETQPTPTTGPTSTPIPTEAPTSAPVSPTPTSGSPSPTGTGVPDYCADVASMQAYLETNPDWTQVDCVDECSTLEESKTLQCAAAFAE